MTPESLYSRPLEQQVGQLFFIGLQGTEFDAEARLLDEVRAASPVELLMGIDQEGGLVDRLRKIFTPMPSARAIREHGDLAGARALGRITGEALRMLGFNINFSPTMEMMTAERDLLSNGLYSRSFVRSPAEVLGYTTVYMRGL